VIDVVTAVVIGIGDSLDTTADTVRVTWEVPVWAAVNITYFNLTLIEANTFFNGFLSEISEVIKATMFCFILTVDCFLILTEAVVVGE
jgi:hypothetical protein